MADGITDGPTLGVDDDVIVGTEVGATEGSSDGMDVGVEVEGS